MIVAKSQAAITAAVAGPLNSGLTACLVLASTPTVVANCTNNYHRSGLATGNAA